MNSGEILTAARAKLATGITSHAYARDVQGRYALFSWPDACQFCTIGAIASVVGSIETADAVAEIFLREFLPSNKPVRDWSDELVNSGKSEEVLAAFDAAIAKGGINFDFSAAVPPANPTLSEGAKSGHEP